MPRKKKHNRKDSPRTLDQGDWQACIAWRRMFVACSNAALDLRIPTTNFLLDVRALVMTVDEPFRHARADGVLRGAWEHLHSDFLWGAVVYGISARAIASEMDDPDGHELMGWDFCRQIRDTYPRAPAGFEKIGRSTNKDE